jgi:hypothetical protein
MAVNDPPEIDGVPNINVYEDQNYILEVSSYLSDIDNELDELTVTTNSTYASVVDTNITFNYPSSDEISYEFVKIEVDDGDLTDHQNITVTVISEGILYVLLPIPEQNAVEDIELVVDMADYISLSSGVSITDFTFVINSTYGVISGSQFTLLYPNSFNYPSGRNYEFIGVDITYLPESEVEKVEFKINVLPVNDAPWLSTPDVNPDTGNEDDTFTFSVKYFDIDGTDNPDINVVIDDVLYGMVYVSGNKNVASDGALYQYLCNMYEGVHTYYFTCDDMAGEFNSFNTTSVFSLTVTASGVEPPPVDTNDTDKDGMPDEWEKKYGLDPNDPSDANIDSDGDNFTNLEEYLGIDGKPGGGDDTSPIDIGDFPHEPASGDDDDDESDDSGFLLIIGLLLVVVVIVIIVVAIVVMKRKKPEPEQYPHPPAPGELQEIAPPPIDDVPIESGEATIGAPVGAQPEYYPPVEQQIEPASSIPPEQLPQDTGVIGYQYPPQEDQYIPSPPPGEQPIQEPPIDSEYSQPSSEEPAPLQPQPEQPQPPVQAQPAQPAAPAAMPVPAQPVTPGQQLPVQPLEGTEQPRPQPTPPSEDENQ